MRQLFSIVLCLITLSATFAQNSYKGPPTFAKITLTGNVIETSSKQPLEYATIILTHTKTKKVTGGVTNSNGRFSIDIPKGPYTISVEFIGFTTKTFPQQTFSKNTNLGTIVLSEDAETLDEVEIIAEKSTVEIRLDKKIYNVGKDMTLKGGNASDVLDNVPSVNVDAEGAVSLRGNENVRILIDGKPSALVGLSGADALRNLPADAIEKVEVVTSPSARYDAEGSAGILNIILRKGKIIGFNGSIGLTLGQPDQFGIAPNLNYRTKKINLFSNLGYNYRKGPGNSQNFFTFFEDDNETIESYRDEDRKFDRKNTNYNGSLGLEYYINDNSSITGMFFYRKSNGEDIATNTTGFYDVNRNLDSISNRIETEIEDGIDTQYSINYTNNFDGNGKKLTIDLQYGDSDESEISPVVVDGEPSEDNEQDTSSKDQLYQIDYVHPIGENNQLELGHKSTLQDLSSDFRANILNSEYDPSNAIEFKQYIYAFYTQFGSKINKFSYLLGLRTEITDIDLFVITDNQFNDKNYTEWFPTINLGYEINDTDNFTLGYSRRIQRPRHWFINPFESRSSATNIFRGNPDINPSFTSSFDLGYTTKIKKLTLNSSLYYQYSTDIMQRVVITERRLLNDNDNDTTPIFIRTPINGDSEHRYGFELTTNYTAAKWARFSATFNYFRFKTNAFDYLYTGRDDSDEQVIPLEEVNNGSWFTRFNARLTLPAKIQWQTRLLFRGPQQNAQGNRENMFVANVSLSKDLFKEKASLVLNASDLFNSRKREYTTYNPGSIAEGAFQWRERQITLSFTYRFNQQKKKEDRKQGYEGGGDMY